MILTAHSAHNAPSHHRPGAFSRAEGMVRVPETLDLHALLSASEAAMYAGVSVQAIVNWRNRGKLPVAKDAHGNEIRCSCCHRPKYRLLDVARAEAATSKRARRAALQPPFSCRTHGLRNP